MGTFSVNPVFSALFQMSASFRRTCEELPFPYTMVRLVSSDPVMDLCFTAIMFAAVLAQDPDETGEMFLKLLVESLRKASFLFLLELKLLGYNH